MARLIDFGALWLSSLPYCKEVDERDVRLRDVSRLGGQRHSLVVYFDTCSRALQESVDCSQKRVFLASGQPIDLLQPAQETSVLDVPVFLGLA